MPGIAGIISQKISAVEGQRFVKTMLATMRHENFYATQNFSAPEMGIFSGGVTLENLPTNLFSDNEKKVALIFTGEIFLDSEIATAEKLIALYEKSGEKFFEKLNGLFSGLLIDQKSHRAFLFNDRFAMERIYWHENADGFYFASEAKALLRILPELREFDAQGVAQFLAVGCPLETRTLFRGIEKLPGGACWIFENKNCRREKYFSPDNWEAQPEISLNEFENQFAEIFKKILPRYFSGNSKVGIGLTGGLDTRMIMAARPQDSVRQSAYTFTGTSGKTLDDRIATNIAKVCDLDHELIRLKNDFFSDFATGADQTVFVTDGTFGILGAHEIYFHRRARELAPVRLTGNFGSEVFRGISTFKPLELSPEIFTENFLEKIHSATVQISTQKNHSVTTALFKEIPWHLFGSVAAGRSQVVFRTPYLDNDLARLAYQLPVSARKSSLPAARFVKKNHKTLGRIATDRGYADKNSGAAFLFRRIFAEVTFKLDYYYCAGLPRSLATLDSPYRLFISTMRIAGLHKYLHYRRWLRNELADYLRASLARAQTHASLNLFFNPKFFSELAEQHISGRKNFAPEINAILTLESVARQLFKNLPRGFSDN
jgi:asparagine synthase (glutamine-hydrolysing)